MASILVVDDLADVSDILALALENAGHAVTAAPGAAEARGLLRDQRFDLAVVDLLMPREDGAALVSELDRAGVAVIVTSGHPEAVERLGLANLPFLLKPFRMAQLIAMVREVLAGRERV